MARQHRPSPPALDSPDAWRVVTAAFASTFTAFGVAYSFGVVLEDLRADLGAGRGEAAALFSLTSFVWFAFGGVTGAAADRFGPRRVLLAGAIAMGLGLTVTSQADAVGPAIAAYGVGVGIGVACAYVPMVALVGAWFERRRTLALGIAVAGVGAGTLAVPPAVAALTEAFGWRRAFLVLAVLATAILALSAVWLRPAPRSLHPPGARLGDAVRTADYRWLYLAGVLMSMALYVPFVYLPSYAEDRGVDPVLAAGLIGAIGMASILGRLALGAVASSFGLVRTYQACFAVMATSFAVWAVAGGRFAAMAAFALALGFGYGGFVALTPAVIAARFGVERLGSLLGVLYTGPGVGAAVGPPLAGAAIDAAGHRPAILGALAVAALATAALAPVSATVHGAERSGQP
jgi:MFS family permease